MTIRRIVGLAVLAGALIVPAGMAAGAPVTSAASGVLAGKPTPKPNPTQKPHPTPKPQPTPKPCKTAYHCGKGGTVISSSTFTVRLPQSHLALHGVATRSQYGTQVWVVRSSVQHVPHHGIAFKAIATGHVPAMHLTQKGSLYQYVPATNHWVRVSAVVNSKIHAAVLSK